MPRYAELHCHTDFSFLDGASPADDLVERAAQLHLAALAVADHQGLYGAVRFASAAEEAGIHAVIGVEVELFDSAAPDPHAIVLPARRPSRRRGVVPPDPLGDDPGRLFDSTGAGHDPPAASSTALVEAGRPVRPRSVRARLPGHREPVREDLRGVADGQRGPHLVLLARDAAGYRSLCRLVSGAQMAGTKGVPRFTHGLLGRHAEGLAALSGCRHGEIARRLLAGDRAGARNAAERYARFFGPGGFFLELQHHLLPDDDWLVAETARLANELGLPVVVTNDVHYALPEDRELQDVLVAIRHGLTLDGSAHLRRPNGEYHLKGAGGMLGLPPAEPDAPPLVRRAWAEGMATAVELAESCRVDLGFERYRFPGFQVPRGETPFSHLVALCQEGARRRYHPLTPAVVRQLAHELDVIERTGLAEFFLICWDLMHFARERSIPAQGRGSAGDSIVAYVLGITRVDPIRHRLLFERFINEGRTTYPDVDIDFASSRREEVLQYVYRRYGPEHTGMVCNIVTYRARSAVREVGYALGFPRPLVDRVAKALETYDSVMVRRDLETDGGFAEFFAPGEDEGRALARSAVRARAEGEARGVLSGVRPSELGSSGPPGPARLALPDGPPATPRPDGATRPAFGGSEGERARAASPSPAGPLSPPSFAAAHGPSSLGEGDEVTPLPRGAAGPSSPAITREAARTLASATGFVDRMGQLNHARGGRIPTRDAPPRPLPDSLAPRTVLRRGRSDDEGGPGDTPVSVAWLHDEAMHRLRTAPDDVPLPPLSSGVVGGQRLDPETGMPLADRPVDRVRPRGADPSRGGMPASGGVPASGEVPPGDAAEPRPGILRAPPHSSVARLEPEPAPRRRTGSTIGLSPWERWLELCARIDGRPRHLSIHVGGMLVTAAPLVDIAPLERATMPGRVVVQYDKRDIETIKLIKLDLLGLRMLSAIDDALRDIAADCAVVVDLDRLPEDLPEVFRMIQAADTVGVFQVESRAQMQTLPKSRPTTLDDLVVEVAIIRPGPIQGNAVHPYLRRRQGIEPVAYLHPSLEPILRETLGVILYQEQVMEIAIQVAGFTAAESDGFRRAMGTWRSSREMEKLHRGFVEGCIRTNGVPEADAEELYRQVAAFASFGFNKSHAAAFARTAYESCFLKLYYPAQFVAGLVNNQPMGFYPVEVLINDAKRHGVAVLPVDLNRSRWRTATEWVGMPGEPLPEGAGISRRPSIVRSSACIVPDPRTRHRWGAEVAAGYGIRLGLHLVKGIGEEHGERLDAELEAGPYGSLADVVARTGLSEEVIERLIRAGGLDSLGRPRRELLWQLREVASSTGRALVRSAVRVRAGEGSGRGPVGGMPGLRSARTADQGPPARSALPGASPATPLPGRASGPLSLVEEETAAHPPSPLSRDATLGPSSLGEGVPQTPGAGGEAIEAPGAASRPIPLDLRLPPTEAPELPEPSELERLADSYAILSLDARRQVVELFRPALDRLGALTISRLAEQPRGRVTIGGLVVTRQHPMTAKGTVFLALEDETGMANVTLWPDTWARLRGVVRRHALLWVEGELQREGAVVNLVAAEVRPLPETARVAGGPPRPQGVRHLGYAGMRRG
jgi:DNA polymerase III alpha subunit